MLFFKIKIYLVAFLLSFPFYARASSPIEIKNLDLFISSLEYPIHCRKQAIEGKVWIKITVDKDGKIENYVILKTPNKLLSEECIAKLGKLTFTPAKNREGENTKASIVLPVSFNLKTE